MTSSSWNIACTLSFALMACNEDTKSTRIADAGHETDAGTPNDTGPTQDAARDAGRLPGTDYTYVISAIKLPMNGSEATMFGFDLDGRTEGNPIDNALGGLLASLSAVTSADLLGPALDDAIAKGHLISLVNINATDLSEATEVNFSLLAGATEPTPTPAPCADEKDAVCGHHLNGTGVFSFDDTTEVQAPLRGEIVSGTLTAGPGNVALRIFLNESPVTLPLQNARVEIRGLTANTWADEGNKLGGAVSNAEIASILMPALAGFFRAAFEDSCDEGGAVETNCGCTGNGGTVQALFDRTPEDCAISDQEVVSFIDPLLQRDIDLNDDGTNDAVSIGVGLSAVGASF